MTVKRVRSVLVVLVAAVSASACVTKGDVRDLRSSFSSQLEEVRARQDSLRVEIGRVLTQLDRLEEGQKNLIVGRSTELERQLSQLRTELQQLTALVGQTQRRIEEGLRAAAAASASTAGDTAALGSDTTARSPSAGERSGGGAGGDPEALYRAALQQLRRGAYETARSALEEFLSANPDHRLAPDAQFYVAESYREAGDQAGALDEYRQVVELYPNSNRAPAALFRQGDIQMDRGIVDAARRLFQQIIRGYPDSPEARPATRRLEEIGGS